jgi:hypothetical protein
MFKGNDYILESVLKRQIMTGFYENAGRHNWAWQLGSGRKTILIWSDWKYYNPITVSSVRVCTLTSKSTGYHLPQCWSRDKKKRLAKLHSAAKAIRKRGQPVEETTLEIFPDGYEHFDLILLSGLILERLRHVPCGVKYNSIYFKDLWNLWPFSKSKSLLC